MAEGIMDSALVVGGGVIGLTTAVLLAERGTHVRVWARETAEAGQAGEAGEAGEGARATASAVSGGLIWPYRIEPREKVLEWSVRSFRHFAWLAEQPGDTGVRLVRGHLADEKGAGPREWLELVGSPPRTPLVDMSSYLLYLRGRLAAAGGVVEQRPVSSLAEAAAEAPVVVNCSGLGARELVPDAEMLPVRGQIVVVENPGIDEWYLASEPDSPHSTYVLPQPYGLLLGGTADEGAEDRSPDMATAEDIVRRCARVHPELAHARVLEHRVGLRPCRPRVRLETEVLPDGTPCVHNYGHGGAGVTVSWGCAREAARLVHPDGSDDE